MKAERTPEQKAATAALRAQRRAARAERTDAEKAQAQQERMESRAVRRYLDVLTGRDQVAPTGRSPQKEIERLNEKLAKPELSSMARLLATQRRKEIEETGTVSVVTRSIGKGDPKDEFVQYAAAFSARKGIARSTWIELGVPEEVLDEAGIEMDFDDDEADEG